MHKETKASEQVCKECGRPESYVGHTRYAMDTHHFEPAPPSAPRKQPCGCEGENCSYHNPLIDGAAPEGKEKA